VKSSSQAAADAICQVSNSSKVNSSHWSDFPKLQQLN